MLKHLKALIRKNKDHSRFANCECICHSDIEDGSIRFCVICDHITKGIKLKNTDHNSRKFLKLVEKWEFPSVRDQKFTEEVMMKTVDRMTDEERFLENKKKSNFIKLQGSIDYFRDNGLTASEMIDLNNKKLLDSILLYIKDIKTSELIDLVDLIRKEIKSRFER